MKIEIIRHCERSEAIQSGSPRLLRSLAMTSCIVLIGCTPTVQVQAPDKPIEINMNVNIQHHIKVEIEKDVEQTIKKNGDIF